ncbi:hypothetical protein B0T21DRAFT_299646 [Apiosordaria backusii]|uniref:Uncharacterized protein n=1 Tax=Apiosordaria backusii TaxID=314023 RepID=A0AA39ZSR3_9PEZI|nr:hypothetical protein B0T21DRAFT_299646 [Apiosordaria backusii]
MNVSCPFIPDSSRWDPPADNYQCKDCIENTQRMCQRCGGGYCLIHNEGSDMVSVGRTLFSVTETTWLTIFLQCDCKLF